MQIEDLAGVSTLVYPEGAGVLASPAAVRDLVGEAMAHGAGAVLVPAARLAEDFFRLRTGFAGDVLQTFTNYQIRLFILGDITGHLEASGALRDFVGELNRVGTHLVLPDRQELEAAL